MSQEFTTKPVPQTIPSAHLTAIDGLRGVACFLVIWHHCVHYGNIRPGWVGRSVSYGYLGVDLFFLLSGFCLAFPFLQQNKKQFVWKEYLRRRVLRILPPYWAVLAALMGIGVLLQHAPRYWFPQAAQLAFSWSQLTLTAFLIGPAYSASFWTLCLEARWYFVFPILLVLARRFGAVAVVMGSFLMSGSYEIVRTIAHLPPNMGLTWGRLILFLPTFALGIWAAELFKKKEAILRFRWSVPVLLAGFIASILAIFCWLPYLQNWNFIRVVIGAAWAFAFVLLALYVPTVQRVLGSRAIAFLGTASYSIYLVHEPVIVQLAPILYRLPMPQILRECLLLLLFPPLLLGIGIGFFLLIEQPLLYVTMNRPKTVRL